MSPLGWLLKTTMLPVVIAGILIIALWQTIAIGCQWVDRWVSQILNRVL